MHATGKRLIRGALVAIGFATLGMGAASAGEWRINANKCPDLREDRWDRREDHGRYDRREDRRDERVIRCPARAWYYVPDRHERRGYYSHPRPREVIVYRDGRQYYRNDRGALLSLRIG